jgi:hypothetical protein
MTQHYEQVMHNVGQTCRFFDDAPTDSRPFLRNIPCLLEGLGA